MKRLRCSFCACEDTSARQFPYVPGERQVCQPRPCKCSFKLWARGVITGKAGQWAQHRTLGTLSGLETSATEGREDCFREEKQHKYLENCGASEDD